MRSFASDNNSGVHEKIFEALQKANTNHCVSYGDDIFTEQAIKDIKKTFNQNAEVFFVYNGTGANITALQACLQSYQAVICPETAHINVDECGAFEKFTGCKTIFVKTDDSGKITIDAIKACLHGIDDQHHVQPKVVSITQATELGSVYSISEIKNIADFCHANNLLLHLDGARLANAAAYLNCSLANITCNAGVDVLSFGCTKNGLMFGECVVFFNSQFAKAYKFYRKQGMQLHSKMRFIACQFSAILQNNLWLENAQKANNQALKLYNKLQGLVKFIKKPEVNSLFPVLPANKIVKLQSQYFFYVWDEHTNVVRFMTTFDTTDEDIDNFVNAVKNII